MKPKPGKMFEIIEIEENMEKIGTNERKLKDLCSRTDNLESFKQFNIKCFKRFKQFNNLESLQNINNRERSSAVRNSQEKTVNNF